MIRHPQGTEKLIDTRDKRRKDEEERIRQDQKIRQAIRRDQRPEKEPKHDSGSKRQKVA
jgi:hypothetical protein